MPYFDAIQKIFKVSNDISMHSAWEVMIEQSGALLIPFQIALIGKRFARNTSPAVGGKELYLQGV